MGKWRRRSCFIREQFKEVEDSERLQLLSDSFGRWIQGCVRHGEQLSLMQSFRDVKLDGVYELLMFAALSQMLIELFSLPRRPAPSFFPLALKNPSIRFESCRGTCPRGTTTERKVERYLDQVEGCLQGGSTVARGLCFHNPSAIRSFLFARDR